ncbi:MAG: hypothetical protein PHH41_08110 [Sulfurimonas sp.]|nr:hypothetical protein [Sulfurimonas sp.]MDD5203087.1 hypothetical protein [Sulfurimonas sp.]
MRLVLTWKQKGESTTRRFLYKEELYTMGAVVDTMLSAPSHTDLNPNSHIWTWNKLYSTTDS